MHLFINYQVLFLKFDAWLNFKKSVIVPLSKDKTCILTNYWTVKIQSVANAR